MKMCDIGKCPEKSTYTYNWEQGKLKAELNLCLYCNFQLLGEILKQQQMENMAEAIKLELED